LHIAKLELKGISIKMNNEKRDDIRQDNPDKFRKYDVKANTGIGYVSLEGVHSSIKVPDHNAGFWQHWKAFVGPALLISVGYMDPGNWGTDLMGGAQFKFDLLWVVGVASLMAIFMQVLAARLGVVTGKDLAQCCRDLYPIWSRWPNWLFI